MMAQLDPTHHYSQQAGKATQQAFQWSAGSALVILAVVVFTAWWWLLLAVPVILGGFAWYLSQRKTVQLLDVTQNRFVTVAMPDWRAFQKAHPELVEKAGADQD